MTGTVSLPYDSVGAALVSRLEGRETETVLTIEGEPVDGALVLARAAARQRQMRDVGLTRGDRIFVQSGRGCLFWSDLIAVWGLGGVVIPLNPAISEDEFAHQLLKAGATALIGDLALPGTETLTRLADDPEPSGGQVETGGALDNEAAILFTSGSSGEPKGVRLTNRAVLGNALAAVKAIGFQPSDRLFIAIRFYFTSAICHFLAALLARGSLVATERPLLLAEFYAALKQSGCNAFGGAPIQLRWIAECHADDPVALRWLMSSGDRLPVEVIRELRRVAPDTQIHTFYGLTELGGRFCALPADRIDTHAGSVGRPIEGMHLRILGPSGEDLPPNSTGEIVAYGDYAFLDYINDPDKTAQVFDGTYLRTGDVGYLDEDGMLFVDGRNDDVFKVSGRKVSANIIQHALMDCGIFADAAVVRLDHPELGSIARACYCLKEGEEFRRGAVLGRLRKSLPKHFLPSVFTELPGIPRTGSGKIDRRKLRDMLQSIDESAKNA